MFQPRCLLWCRDWTLQRHLIRSDSSSVCSDLVMPVNYITFVTYVHTLIVTCQWRLTFRELCQAALRLYGKYATYDVPSANQFCCLSLLRWFWHDCTMAALLSLLSPGASWTVHSQCWMQQQDLYITVVMAVSMTVFHHCCTTFTGCMSQNALNFILLFLCSTAATGQRLDTWHSDKRATDDDSLKRLRSASFHKLIVQWSRLTMAGDCAFGITAPCLWNDLPAECHFCTVFVCLKNV